MHVMQPIGAGGDSGCPAWDLPLKLNGFEQQKNYVYKGKREENPNLPIEPHIKSAWSYLFNPFIC